MEVISRQYFRVVYLCLISNLSNAVLAPYRLYRHSRVPPYRRCEAFSEISAKCERLQPLLSNRGCLEDGCCAGVIFNAETGQRVRSLSSGRDSGAEPEICLRKHITTIRSSQNLMLHINLGRV